MSDATPIIRRLGPNDTGDMRALIDLLGRAFEDVDYRDPPPVDYLQSVLGDPGFVALCATVNDTPAGGLIAYEFRKFEQVRSEYYIYDLVVDAAYRRRGIATALIEALKPIAAARGGYVFIIQTEPDNAAALALYGKLGTREEVVSFDIDVS
ncbi:MAG: GNAT family N-acetyltransferase [Pseudomonadota bacterium]